jgi:hypothetical protein
MGAAAGAGRRGSGRGCGGDRYGPSTSFSPLGSLGGLAQTLLQRLEVAGDPFDERIDLRGVVPAELDGELDVAQRTRLRLHERPKVTDRGQDGKRGTATKVA